MKHIPILLDGFKNELVTLYDKYYVKKDKFINNIIMQMIFRKKYSLLQRQACINLLLPIVLNNLKKMSKIIKRYLYLVVYA